MSDESGAPRVAKRAPTDAERRAGSLLAALMTPISWRIAPWVFAAILGAEIAVVVLSSGGAVTSGHAVRVALLSVPGAAVGTLLCLLVLAPTVLIPLARLRADLTSGASDSFEPGDGRSALFETDQDGIGDRWIDDGRDDEVANVSRLMRTLQRTKDRALEAERRAVAADRAKTEFLTSVSHELRTPLTAVLGYSELILMACENADPSTIDLPRLSANAARIRESGQQLRELIEGLLMYGRTATGKLELHLEPVNIARLVDVVVGTLQPQADKAGIALVAEIEPQLPQFSLDRGKLRQTLLNIAGNALKFTDQGQVKIAARRVTDDDGDWLVFEIRDTGIGIPADKLEAVFEPFTQADGSASRRHGGVGLGLAISRRFCQLMNGVISVVSEPGAGSSFTVRLPARAAPPVPAAPEPADPPESA